MHLAYTEQEQDLRDRLRAYYDDLLDDGTRAALARDHGVGPTVRRLVRRMGQDGWLGIGWPTEYGGQGRTAVEQFIFFDESMRCGAPVPMIMINSVAPTLMEFGTDDQKRHFLPRILVDDVLPGEISARTRYELLACRSHALFVAGDPGAAVSGWAERPAAEVDDHQHRLERAEVALARLFAGDMAGASADASAVLDAPVTAPPLARATAHSVLAWLDAAVGEFPSALAHCDASAADRARPGVVGPLRYGPHLVRAAVADAAADDVRWVDSIGAARAQASDHGLAVFDPMLHAVEAIHLYRTGEWDDAFALVGAGTSSMADTGARLAANWIAAVGALVELERGDAEAAEQRLDTTTEAGVLLGQDWVALARARASVRRGDDPGALALLGVVAQLLAAAGSRSWLGYFGPELARLVACQGDDELAGWLCGVVGDLPAGLPPVLEATAEVVRGHLAADPDQLARGARGLAAAGRTPEAGRALAAAAVLHAGRDDDAARDAARGATTLFERCGALVATAELRAALRSRGVRFRAASASRATSGWASLTPTEQRIVDLVAEGLSNAEIASRLVVSRRTVESHLARVFRKLDVRSRGALARLAADGAAGSTRSPA